MLPVYPITDLRNMLEEAVLRYRDRVALQSKKHGSYVPLTYGQLGERVRELATVFFEWECQPGDRIAILSENRSEWALTYLAAVTSGFVALPIDKDLTPREMAHIFNFAQPAVAICSAHYVDSLRVMREEIPSLKRIVSMEDDRGGADLCFPEALQMGYESLQKGSREYAKAEVSPEDVAAIIFTSGTTGNSKGVMLTHGNLAADIVATAQFVAINDENDVLLSVLPLHHTYECTGGFLLALYQGSSVAHAENLRRIPENLKEARATVMLGVPILFESFYRRIEEGIRKKGEKKFKIARGIAGFSEAVLGLNIRRKLFKEVHKKLGGHLRLMISGGAAVNPRVARGFRDLGIDFIQGYGMTETAPIVAVNRVNYFKDASVGPPLPGVEVKIVEGEIAVRGPIVMKGYYLNEAATRQTLREGWIHTGDLGYFDDDGFLYISGRKKSVIVTPNGKNVYPEEVEAVLNESPYILESLVWGGPEEDPRDVIIQAIIVPDSEKFDEEFGAASYDDATLQKVIAREVKRSCKNLAQYKRVKKFSVRLEEFEKTTTRKVKRYLYTGKPRKLG